MCFKEVTSDCVFQKSLFPPVDYGDRRSPGPDHFRKLHILVSKRDQMGLGRAWGMCPGWAGHGQHLPRPPVHPVFHGVFTSVSVCASTSLWMWWFYFKCHVLVMCACSFWFADGTTAHAKEGTWTVLSLFGSCCCGSGVTPATWLAPFWQTSFHFRWHVKIKWSPQC